MRDIQRNTSGGRSCRYTISIVRNALSGLVISLGTFVLFLGVDGPTADRHLPPNYRDRSHISLATGSYEDNCYGSATVDGVIMPAEGG